MYPSGVMRPFSHETMRIIWIYGPNNYCYRCTSLSLRSSLSDNGYPRKTCSRNFKTRPGAHPAHTRRTATPEGAGISGTPGRFWSVCTGKTGFPPGKRRCGRAGNGGKAPPVLPRQTFSWPFQYLHPLPRCPKSKRPGCRNSDRISADSTTRGPGRLKY